MVENYPASEVMQLKWAYQVLVFFVISQITFLLWSVDLMLDIRFALICLGSAYVPQILKNFMSASRSEIRVDYVLANYV